MLLIWVALQNSNVQDRIAHYLTDTLSKDLNTTLTIDDIEIDFFKTIDVKGIYFEDQSGDTLLYADHLYGDIAVFSLFNKKIILDEIELEGAKLNLDASSDISNFQFFLDYVAGDGTPSTSQPWIFSMNGVDIKNSYINYLSDGQTIKSYIKGLKANFEIFDIDQSIAKVNSIHASGSRVEIISTEQKSPATTTELDSISFPVVPWDIDVDLLSFQDIYIDIHDENYTSTSDAVDTRDLKMNLESLVMEDIQLGDNYTFHLSDLEMEERSGLRISETSLDFLFDNEGIAVNNLSLTSNRSNINGSFRIVYDDFDAFLDDPQNSLMEFKVNPSTLNGASLKRLRKIVDLTALNVNENDQVRIEGSITKNNQEYSGTNIDIKLNEDLFLRGDATFVLAPNIGNSRLTLDVKKLSTSARRLKRKFPNLEFPDEAYKLGDLTAAFKAHGSVDSLNIDTLALTTQTSTHLYGSGLVRGLPEVDNLSYKLHINSLRAIPEELLSDSLLTEQVLSLGELTYQGFLSGNLRAIDVVGKLNTEIGRLESDLKLTLPQEPEPLKYVGDVKLEQFHLGEFLQDTTYGITSVDLTVDGQGTSEEDLIADIDAVVKEAYFNGKVYKDAKLKGKIDGLSYDGRIKIDDENITVDYDGIVDLSKNNPRLVFEMKLDTINLQKLDLIDDDIRLSGYLRSDLTGSQVDDINGTALIQNLKIYKGEQIYIPGEDILLEVTNEAGQNKSIKLTSPMLDMEAKGKITPSELIHTMKAYVDHYFPVEVIDPHFKDGQVAIKKTHQAFDVSLKTKDINPFLNFFVNEDIKLKDLSIDAVFNSSTPDLQATGKVDSLIYNNYVAQSGDLLIEGSPKQLNIALDLNHISQNGEEIIPEATIISATSDEKMDLSIDIKDEDDLSRFLVGSEISLNGDAVQLIVHDTVVINKEDWAVNKDNMTLFNNGDIDIKDLLISRGDQSIELFTEKDGIKQNINAKFSEFNIDEITKILGKQEDFVTGEIDGFIKYNDVNGNGFLTTDLVIDSIAYEGKPVGKLSLNAAQKVQKNTIEGSFDLIGKNNDALGSLSYNILTQKMDGFLEVAKMEMRLIDPFMQEIIDDSDGYLFGDFDIKGTPVRPDISGNLLFDNASTMVVLSKTRYKIKEQKISFDNKLIALEDIILYDENDREAVVNGKITHSSFQDMFMDLSVNTQGFQILNTTSADNGLFYGNIFIDSEMSIIGPPDDLKIDATGKAVNKSNLVLSPFFSTDEIISDDYIIFANPDELKKDTIKKTLHLNKDLFPVDVNMSMEIDSDAEFTFVVDPITGDRLVAHGKADLNIQFKKNGDILIFGPYKATSGNYVFSYGVIEKKFEIKPGGTVTFSGDPLLAKLDIDAVYTTYTDIYDLIKSEVDASSLGGTSKKNDVEVVLNLAGDILKPNITLDIVIPADDRNAIVEAATRKLDALRANPTELNNQVFGLLLFDSFIVTDNAIGGGLDNATESIVLGSVSSLITNQLNNLASNLIKGVDVSFDVNNYTNKYSDNGGLVTELGVDFSKRFLNDRITLKAGGNFNLESSSDQAEFTSLAGDFVLEYRLNEQGNYVLRVFNKTNYDRLIDENNNKTGVSIFLKKDLD